MYFELKNKFILKNDEKKMETDYFLGLQLTKGTFGTSTLVLAGTLYELVG